MGGAAGKHKAKTAYEASKDTKDSERVLAGQDGSSGYDVGTAPHSQSNI
jgi:hypothetical protein